MQFASPFALLMYHRALRKGLSVVVAMLAVCCLALACLPGPALAQTQAVTADPAQSPKIQLLLDLLGDKDVQKWANEQRSQQPTTAEPEPVADAGLLLTNRLTRLRAHITGLIRAVPKLPEQIAAAMQRLDAETGGYGPFALGAILVGLLAVGIGAAVLVIRFTGERVSWGSGLTPGSPRGRFTQLSKQLVVSLGSITAFAVSSIGMFTMLSWPNLVHEIIVLLLLAGLVTWAAWSVLTVLLAPSATGEAASATQPPTRRFRVVPLSAVEAGLFRSSFTVAVGWFFFGYALVSIVRLLGMDLQVSQIVAYVLGIGLLAIGFYVVFRRSGDEAGDPAAAKSASGSLLASGFVALWLLWATGSMLMFWLLLVVLVLPIALKWSHLTLSQIFQVSPVYQQEILEEEQASPSEPETPPSLWWPVVDQAVKAVLIFSAVAILLRGWDVDLNTLANNQHVFTKLARGALKIVAIVLVSNLAWQIVRTMIDSYLAAMPDLGDPGRKETVRQAKLRTLLPIIRNGSMVFILALSIMMALSALGIEIGPLLASAGIVGVAVGFGAQTLVKDVFSGMFYLLDDAFRIGEYIVAGSYKGTVESFSLRSVRLRHHRGPIYTIPFGDLGAVQNLSRDFVIDKLSFQVTYDTDLEKARKLIKKAGQELAADPEIGPKIIEPLKMQRVENFGEYGIEIKTKVTCVPGGQWEVRKKLYPMIKQLFEENGIEFARPTVKVSGSGTDNETVAARTIAAKKARAAKAAG